MSTAQQEVTSTVHSRASIDVRAIALPRAGWETDYIGGRLSVKPQKATWYGHVVRGKSAHDVTVLPMIGCPSCGGVLFISHTPETAKALGQLLGMKVPVAHRVDSLGKVSPDILCQHGRCDFHRRVYLDKWNKTKQLWAIAYIDADSVIKIDYCHAVDRREAAHHYAASTALRKGCRFIDAGPAVGFYVNEKTGRVTAD
jgi:hypothetical protein